MRLFLLAALLLSACDSASDEEPGFGDAYTVLVTDDSPVIADGRLRVDVEYSGGCEEHDFVVRSRADGDAAEVWIVHDGRGDTCEALQAATIQETLPGSVLDAERVTLLAPSGLIVLQPATR